MTMDATQDGGKATVNMKIHVANLGEMELKLTADQKTTSEAPKTAPPKDATIVKADEAAAAPVAP